MSQNPLKNLNIFHTNAAELERLREQVDKRFRKRGESAESTAAWKEAARAFHLDYDRLAFPGGLSREFELLRLGDPTAIEMAIRYLEANPWYFRSGYYKADFLKMLGKHPLSEEQRERMRKIILERIHGLPVREIRAYARFARKVSTPQFEAELTDIAENGDRHAARHAQWVLDCLRSAGIIPRRG